MYNGFDDVLDGFSKNLFPAFSRSLPLLLWVVYFLLNVCVLPPLWALWGWQTHATWTWLPLGTYLCLAAIRFGLTLRFGRDSGGYALLNPLAWLLVIGIALSSAYRSLSGRGNAWKGRVYHQP